VSDVPDAGLQAERTSLAWSRTALTASVAALLVTRGGVVTHQSALTIVGVLLLGVAVATLVAARRRHAVIERALAAGRSPVNRRAMLMLATLVVTFGVAVLWSVIA
jgi:uncharacterized membrane protein YidH (DUF202 family)